MIDPVIPTMDTVTAQFPDRHRESDLPNEKIAELIDAPGDTYVHLLAREVLALRNEVEQWALIGDQFVQQAIDKALAKKAAQISDAVLFKENAMLHEEIDRRDEWLPKIQTKIDEMYDQIAKIAASVVKVQDQQDQTTPPQSEAVA